MTTCDCARASHTHGMFAMYEKHGCRCFPCRIEAAAARARYRAGGRLGDDLLVDRTGTRRRLEALHAVGWSETAIARHLGFTKQAVQCVRTHPGPIRRSTAAAIAAAFDELWDRPPTGRYVTRTLAWARSRGFVPPLGWDDIDNDQAPAASDDGRGGVDLVAVERLVSGQPPAHVGRAEMQLAVDQMHRAGRSDDEIGHRVGLSRDAVAKVRQRTDALELARLVETLSERRTA